MRFYRQIFHFFPILLFCAVQLNAQEKNNNELIEKKFDALDHRLDQLQKKSMIYNGITR
jgi:hypothetical protein